MNRERAQVVLAYLGFVVVGVSAGVGGVLLPAQMIDYGVSRSLIGLTFFTFSTGFLVAGSLTGPIVDRAGFRVTHAAGCAAVLVAGTIAALRPPFAVLVLGQTLAGAGSGLLESVLNAHLATLPRAQARLGRLHAFFGMGALIAPVLATWILRAHPWPVVVLVATTCYLPLLVAFVIAHRGDPQPTDTPAPIAAPTADPTGARARGLLGTVAREPAVILAATFLSVYVGLEMSIGSWGFSYLVLDRDRSDLVAGNAVSGFWLGLTAGRFVIAPLVGRWRWTEARTTTVCLVGTAAGCLAVWLAPTAAVPTAGLTVLGFLLAPLFPVVMTVMPRLTAPGHVATAIGLLNGVSVIGGSGLPWLAGALTERVGLWSLFPYVALLAGCLMVVWRSLVPRLAPEPERSAAIGR